METHIRLSIYIPDEALTANEAYELIDKALRTIQGYKEIPFYIYETEIQKD